MHAKPSGRLSMMLVQRLKAAQEHDLHEKQVQLIHKQEEINRLLLQCRAASQTVITPIQCDVLKSMCFADV